MRRLKEKWREKFPSVRCEVKGASFHSKRLKLRRRDIKEELSNGFMERPEEKEKGKGRGHGCGGAQRIIIHGVGTVSHSSERGRDESSTSLPRIRRKNQRTLI